MCYVAPQKSAQKTQTANGMNEFEAYYTADLSGQTAKPEPELTALDLMYAYFDAV